MKHPSRFTRSFYELTSAGVRCGKCDRHTAVVVGLSAGRNMAQITCEAFCPHCGYQTLDYTIMKGVVNNAPAIV